MISRWFVALRRAVPRFGPLALAGVGFALLVAAEFAPWAALEVTGSAAAGGSTDSGLAIGLDRLASGTGSTYHTGALALLGAAGFALTSPTARRLRATGLATGLAAGQVLLVIMSARAALHAFDTQTVLGVTDRTSSSIRVSLTDTGFRVVLGSGVYLGAAGALLLGVAAVTAVAWRRSGWPDVAAGLDSPPAGGRAATGAGQETGTAPTAEAGLVAGQPRVIGPDGERELTVTAMEPLDESYFARPDQY
jgi:hypothetical protein